MNPKRSPPRVLVLDADSPAGAATVQSLGRRGVDVHGAGAGQPLAFGSRRLSRGWTYPDGFDEPRLLDWIRELDEDQQYDLLVPSTEVSLRVMQRVGDDDDLRRRAVLPARDSVEVALDKVETQRLARSLGIPVPESRVVDAKSPERETPSYPVVLKPSRSQVPRNGELVYVPPRIARNRAQRVTFLQEWQEHTTIQEQDFFPGSGVGIECLYEHGRLRWSFSHRRLHELPLTGGASTYRQSIEPPPALLDCARRLLDELEWHGVAMVEFRVDAQDDFVLVEVNPRLWGSLPLAIGSGVDFPFGLWTLARGEDLDQQPSYRTGYRMRSLIRDVEWMRENWTADHGDPLLLTRPRLGSLVEWLRVLTGKEGWDLVELLDPGPLGVQARSILAKVARAVRVRIDDRLTRRRLRARHHRNLRRLTSEDSVGSLKHVEFVCHGNICRSPFAERLAQGLLPDFEVTSTGLHPAKGRPSPARIVELAREEGIDLSDHRSRSLSDGDAPVGDLLVVMDPENYDQLVSRFPEVIDRVVFLGLFADSPRMTVPDPYAASDDQARSTHALILDGVDGLVRWLNRNRC